MADLGTAGAVVLAGSRESSLKAYEQIQASKSAPVVIDMNGGLEDLPEAGSARPWRSRRKCRQPPPSR